MESEEGVSQENLPQRKKRLHVCSAELSNLCSLRNALASENGLERELGATFNYRIVSLFQYLHLPAG